MIKVRRKKGHSVQDLIGIHSFSRNGLQTATGDFVIFSVAPTNISVLSAERVEVRIQHLMTLLSAVPDLEIFCTDSAETYSQNRIYLQDQIAREAHPSVRRILEADEDFLDQIQVDTAHARQFLFLLRIPSQKRAFETVNMVEKAISEQGFEVRRMNKADLQRFLAIYFGSSYAGDEIGDFDGAQYIEHDQDSE